jgi:DNA-binding NarL/FixJ family response regulator
MGGTTLPGRLLRVTLVISEAMEKRVIAEATALGVEGYVCSYCSGKRLFEAIESTDVVHGLVRIELLVRPAAADGLLAFLDRLQRQAHPVMALLDQVSVYDDVASEGVCPGRGEDGE